MVMTRAAMVVAVLCMLAGCSLHWPWARRPVPPPQPVQELLIESTGQAPTIAQYWDRNALLLNLEAAGGEGTVRLRRRNGHEWPIRLEFRARPGQFASLEVQGDQRLVFALPVSGEPNGAAGENGALALLAVPAGVYGPTTAAIDVHWGNTMSAIP